MVFSNYVYSLESGNPYQLLFYDNSRRGQNLYQTSVLKARLHSNTLRIDIEERDAVDDSFVNDSIAAYFSIKTKPKKIEVYRNGTEVQYEMEVENARISR